MSKASELTTLLAIEQEAHLMTSNRLEDAQEEIEELRAELFIARGQRGDIYNVSTK